MPDPATITVLAGVVILVIKEIFVWGSKIKESDCWGVHIKREPVVLTVEPVVEIPIVKPT
jgi:hypothetical protein